MIKWSFKILLILTSLSFFTSAVELNIGSCHNTFFDQFDTYDKTDLVSFDEVIVDVPDDNLVFFLNSVLHSHYSFTAARQVSQSYCHTYHLTSHPIKLFLLNSVWRI